MLAAPTLAEVQAVDRKLAAIHDRASRAERARMRDVMRELPPYASLEEMLRATNLSLSLSADSIVVAGDTPSPSFTSPASAPGLRFWYGADVGVTQSGGVATAWSDQSGNGRNLVAGGVGNRPAYSASDAAFNGLPTLTGDATDYMQCTFASAVSMPCDVYVACKGASSSSRVFFDGLDATHRAFLSFSAALAIVAGTNVSSITVAGGGSASAIVVRLSFNGASSAIYKNDSVTPIGTGSMGPVSLDGITMFAPYTLTQSNNGNTIAEIFACDVLSPSMATGAMQWLGTKYGFAVT